MIRAFLMAGLRNMLARNGDRSGGFECCLGISHERRLYVRMVLMDFVSLKTNDIFLCEEPWSFERKEAPSAERMDRT